MRGESSIGMQSGHTSEAKEPANGHTINKRFSVMETPRRFLTHRTVDSLARLRGWLDLAGAAFDGWR